VLGMLRVGVVGDARRAMTRLRTGGGARCAAGLMEAVGEVGVLPWIGEVSIMLVGAGRGGHGVVWWAEGVAVCAGEEHCSKVLLACGEVNFTGEKCCVESEGLRGGWRRLEGEGQQWS